MRYAEIPAVEEAVYVSSPVQRVWALASDITVPARFSPELRSARWLSDAGLVLGARFEGHNRHHALGEWRTVCQVATLDPPYAFGWAVFDLDGRFGDPPDSAAPLARWDFRLLPDAAGTRLSLRAQIGPARSGVSLALDRYPEQEEQIVARRLDELGVGIRRTLSGIKALAETGNVSPGG